MHVFFAGATRVEEGFPELQHEIRKRLVSYHYQTDSLDKFYYIDERDKYEMIILDSGAFSAWSKGAVIDIEAYADYALKWQDKVSYIVNLDVIPAKPGVKPDREEIERSASKGYENYHYLISRGIPKEKLIHVFHQHEDKKWLIKMVHEDKMPYIGLSPANDMNVTQKMHFLDYCMPYVTDSTGKAIVKFHGFAVTSYELMKRYPWFSVDSSTWAVAGGRGEMFTPMHDSDGNYDFTVAPRKLSISQIGGKADHYKNLSDDSNRKRYLEDYLKSVGVPIGCQLYLRFAKESTPIKGGAFRKCSNSFVINVGFEKEHEEGELLSIEDANKIDINKGEGNIIIMYDGPDGVWYENIYVKGVMNYWKERQRLNAIFMNRFVDILDKQEPRCFNFSKKAIGFNL